MNELTQTLFSKLPEQSQSELSAFIKDLALSSKRNSHGTWTTHNGVLKIYWGTRVGEKV